MTSVAPAPAPAPAPAARRAVPPPPPAWAPVVGATAAATAERLALAEGPEGLSPPPALVWEALRFAPPEGVRVVVVGQDPYPDPADACGLSFATPPGRPLPPSLRSVGAALARQGLLGGGAEGAALPDGDLRAWAAQGVLLLNAAPTTRAGASRAHAAE